jgi:hypothetical protein
MTTKKRTPRQVSERELAISLVLALAESGLIHFSLSGYYDDDEEFMAILSERLNVERNQAFLNKVTKVVRRLVNHDVLISDMSSNHKQYIGEPAKQKDYRLRPGKATLLTQEKTEVTMGPEGEASFLVRRAYPAVDNDC